ncbi:MAG: hypothetical protein QF535_15950 [Anaerolineales bacterium]|nr:hypothetical protein [Anaerolineales bacterium]
MSQLKILSYLLVGTLILLGFAVWFEPADYEIGNKVTIKDCTIWSEPVDVGKKTYDMGGGVSVSASEGVSMRQGYSIGERVGVVKEIEVFRRRAIIRPAHRYKVEFQYEGCTQAEWYYPDDLH